MSLFIESGLEIAASATRSERGKRASPCASISGLVRLGLWAAPLLIASSCTPKSSSPPQAPSSTSSTPSAETARSNSASPHSASPHSSEPDPAEPESVARPTQPNPLATHRVSDLEGTTFDLIAEADGRVLLVDLWATWCKACEGTHRDLEELRRSQDESRLLIVGVSVGETPAKVKRYLERHPFGYPVYLDPRYRLADALSIGELPMLYVLDGKGNIVHEAHALDATTIDRIRTTIEKGIAPQSGSGRR